MTLDSIAEALLTRSEKAGASQVEVYATETVTRSIYIDDSIPKIADAKKETGVGLKYIMGKKIGFTSSTLLAEKTADVVERAKSIATVSSEDPKFESLPEPQSFSGRPDRFHDDTTAEVDSDDLVERVMELVDAAVDSTVTVPNGVLRVSSIGFRVMNSLGIDAHSTSTMVFGFFTAKSEDDGRVGEGVQRCWSRSIEEIDFAGIGSKLNSQAKSVLKSRPFHDQWENIVAVLAPSEGSQMLGSLLGFSASAENVNKGSSPWADRLGEQVAHESLSVSDNGLSERGLLASLVDDEGVPSQNTDVIEDGILRSYLFDSYNANIMDLDSTGNGMRRNPREAQGRFTGPASCGVSTLEMKPGSRTPEEIIEGIESGVYIEHFAWPLVDPMSGAFSNEIRNARLIQDGQLTETIRNALLVGNLYESIQREVLVGSNLEVNSRYLMPTLGFSGLDLVGQ
ncbi:TldD/PmbA family protein [Candidatus Thorarchaeota archaeon]|nr:MAG: TldD/PmbA family protein [Candidatus Thorarchaeota archaeon]